MNYFCRNMFIESFSCQRIPLSVKLVATFILLLLSLTLFKGEHLISMSSLQTVTVSEAVELEREVLGRQESIYFIT